MISVKTFINSIALLTFFETFFKKTTFFNLFFVFLPTDSHLSTEKCPLLNFSLSFCQVEYQLKNLEYDLFITKKDCSFSL